MKRKIVWSSILFLFFIGLTGFFMGFYNALSIGIAATQPSDSARSMTVEEPSDISREAKIPASEGVQIAVFGDSLARGTGDPSGEGFAERVAQGLEARMNEPVDLFNVAVEGMRSDALVSQMADELAIQGIVNARIVMVSIGGNDLRAVARMPLVQQEQAFEESLRGYLANLNQILQQLRSVNEEALILFIGLYHLDYSNPNDRESAYLLEWNAETQRVLEGDVNAQLIPTYDLFQFKLEQYLSPDGLHPGPAGYEAIAERILGNLPE